jgi:hypothetical protein
MALDDFKHVYPTFQLEDELLAQVGRDVMVGMTYHRCKNRPGGKQGTAPKAALG